MSCRELNGAKVRVKKLPTSLVEYLVLDHDDLTAYEKMLFKAVSFRNGRRVVNWILGFNYRKRIKIYRDWFSPNKKDYSLLIRVYPDCGRDSGTTIYLGYLAELSERVAFTREDGCSQLPVLETVPGLFIDITNDIRKEYKDYFVSFEEVIPPAIYFYFAPVKTEVDEALESLSMWSDY